MECRTKRMIVWLRTFLLDNGVFVLMDRTRITAILDRVIKQADYHVWSPDEIEAYSKRSPVFKEKMATPAFTEEIRGLVPPWQLPIYT